MKHHPLVRASRRAWLCLFMACALQVTAYAQGITAYSDTTAVLEDAATDTAWNQPAPFVRLPLEDFFGNDGFLDLIAGMLGLTGFFLILFATLAFLLPLLAVGLVIYLIYRSNRKKKQDIERQAYDPERKTVDEETRNGLLQQAAIRYACWGVGCIAVEWILHLTSLLHVAGVVLLCIAAADWLTALTGKRKKQ